MLGDSHAYQTCIGHASAAGGHHPRKRPNQIGSVMQRSFKHASADGCITLPRATLKRMSHYSCCRPLQCYLDATKLNYTNTRYYSAATVTIAQCLSATVQAQDHRPALQ